MTPQPLIWPHTADMDLLKMPAWAAMNQHGQLRRYCARTCGLSWAEKQPKSHPAALPARLLLLSLFSRTQVCHTCASRAVLSPSPVPVHWVQGGGGNDRGWEWSAASHGLYQGPLCSLDTHTGTRHGCSGRPSQETCPPPLNPHSVSPSDKPQTPFLFPNKQRLE